MKNKKNNPDRIEMQKYCRFCHKHTLHKETKQFIWDFKYFGDVNKMAVKVDVKTIEQKKRMKIVQFFIDLKAEFKRVTWPAKDEVKTAFAAVVCFCLLYTITVGLLDVGFKNLFNLIFK